MMPAPRALFPLAGLIAALALVLAAVLAGVLATASHKSAGAVWNKQPTHQAGAVWNKATNGAVWNGAVWN